MEFFQAKRECELEETFVRLLQERNMTVSTAESCTGGLLAGATRQCGGSIGGAE